MIPTVTAAAAGAAGTAAPSGALAALAGTPTVTTGLLDTVPFETLVAFHYQSVVVALKGLVLAMGALITYFSLKAYRRTGAPALRALTAGFGIVTVGALLAGLLDQFVVDDPALALVVESTFTALGFGVILYSLYVE